MLFETALKVQKMQEDTCPAYFHGFRPVDAISNMLISCYYSAAAPANGNLQPSPSLAPHAFMKAYKLGSKRWFLFEGTVLKIKLWGFTYQNHDLIMRPALVGDSGIIQSSFLISPPSECGRCGQDLILQPHAQQANTIVTKEPRRQKQLCYLGLPFTHFNSLVISMIQK